MKHDLCRAAVVLALATAAAGAAAQENTAKIGAIYYQTHARTTGIQGIGVPPGADAEVGNATTVLFTYERRVAPNLGIELVLGIPPTIKAKATGSVAFLGDDVLSAKIIAPTVFATYHFGEDGAAFRPYVGAGVNYTKFTETKSRIASDVEMSDSVGWAVHAGVDYAINKEWGLFASVAKLKVKSDLVAAGSTVLTTTIDFRPITYSFGLSYRF
jgi:outer membrane protein